MINILDFGADASGMTVSTAAIQSAIDKCEKGDCVYVPEGIYISGALFLKSDMSLFIENGATIKGSDNTDDFPVHTYRWEGRNTECYSSLINAGIGTEGVQNLVIEGGGAIDANGVTLFHKEMKEKKGARGRAVCIQNSSDIIIRGVIIRQSPAWCLHLINCRNVSIDNINIHTKYDEQGNPYEDIFNGDGIDCDSCKNVHITNSLIASQDDCIAIKSGKDAEGRAAAMPSENIIIENCRFESGFGVAIGSEMSGGVRNVKVRNCYFYNTFSIGSVKTCRGRGGVIEDVLFENVE
ncbi:MAG: glycoside hydrolase family 28 protein, partial [Candidatus Ornithomonoglobus sp.]